jgi:hypothetical protein
VVLLGDSAGPQLPRFLDDITVYTVVHPIDTTAHPTIPPGFRWAVMLGWCPTREEATAEGDQNGATGTRALRVAGHNVRYGEAVQVLQLDYDPIASGNDPLFVA